MPLYDLSHPIRTGMPHYPGDPSVSVEPHATHDRDGYAVSTVRFGSHTGTHVDAPRHTEAAGRTLDAFDISTFRFDAALVDCTDCDAGEAIPPARVPDVDADLLVFHTGWDDHWGDDRYRDHPFLAPGTAARCADRGHHVAVDALSPDPTPADADAEPSGLPAHHAILGSGHLIVENLRGLGRLPSRFELHAYPLALSGDGSPVRAVGVVEA